MPAALTSLGSKALRPSTTAGCADVDPRMSCMHNRLIRLFGGTVCMRHAIRVNHIEIRCRRARSKYLPLLRWGCHSPWSFLMLPRVHGYPTQVSMRWLLENAEDLNVYRSMIRETL